MKKNLLCIVALLSFGILKTNAQYAPVTFDYEKSSFNESLPLPAEKNFMLKGTISNIVDQVRLSIYRNSNHKNPVNVSTWRRSFANQSQSFDMPVNYKLRGNGEYDFKIDYFRRVTDAEKEVLKTTLYSTLDQYINAQIEIKRNDINLNKPASLMISDMNDITSVGMQYYDNLVGYEFKGFSDIVKDKINQIKDANLRSGKFAILKSKEGLADNGESKTAYAQNLMQELKDMVHSELGQLINTDLVVIADSKEIKDYPTEKTMNTLPVNIGYGAVYFSGKWNNLNYGSAPYVGLSFPLGNSTFAPFMSKMSISAGIMLTNIDDQTSKEYTGPFIKKPIYLALGYKVFRFVRLNAGVTALENRDLNIDNANSVTLKDISLKPFVGLSAEINIWAGIKN